MNLKGDTDVYDAWFFTCEYTGKIKNMEEENSKSLEWVDISSNIENIMPYQQYALDKYLEGKEKFTVYGWE